MGTTTKQEIAKIREALDALAQRIDAGAIDDDFADGDRDRDLAAWLDRNRDALEERVRQGNAALERGECFVGSAVEHLDRFLEQTRRRQDT